MTTLYIVRDAKSEIAMVAPIATIQTFYKLHQAAVERIAKETENYGTCEIHFRGGDAPITVNRFLGSLT